MISPDLERLRTLTPELSKKDIESRVVNSFFDSALNLLCVMTLDGHFKRINPMWNKVLGWTLDELYKMSFLEMIHFDDLDKANEMYKALLQGCDIIDFKSRLRCKDGTYKTLCWSIHPDFVDEQLCGIGHG